MKKVFKIAAAVFAVLLLLLVSLPYLFKDEIEALVKKSL